jgi:hypothetical protein
MYNYILVVGFSHYFILLSCDDHYRLRCLCFFFSCKMLHYRVNFKKKNKKSCFSTFERFFYLPSIVSAPIIHLYPHQGHHYRLNSFLFCFFIYLCWYLLCCNYWNLLLPIWQDCTLQHSLQVTTNSCNLRFSYLLNPCILRKWID